MCPVVKRERKRDIYYRSGKKKTSWENDDNAARFRLAVFLKQESNTDMPFPALASPPRLSNHAVALFFWRVSVYSALTNDI